MRSILVRVSALSLCFLASSVALADPPLASTHYRAKQVLGTKMMIQGDTAIGTVDDLVFDEAGNLEYLVVENNGKLVSVPFEAAKFNLERRTAVVPLTPEQYKLIPTFTVTTYPSFYAPTYRSEVYRYYGLTPRELRRLGPPAIVRP